MGDGPRMRWYPPQEDTGVAAIATTFSNQATAELEDMKRCLVMTTGEWSDHLGGVGDAFFPPFCEICSIVFSSFGGELFI